MQRGFCRQHFHYKLTVPWLAPNAVCVRPAGAEGCRTQLPKPGHRRLSWLCPKGREEHPQWPSCAPHPRGCSTDCAAVRAQLKVLHPGRLPGITPVGSCRGSRSSLNTYEVSEYDELFTSLCTAQLLQGKAQWQRLCQARGFPCRMAGVTGKAHSMVQLMCHEQS